MGVGRTDVPHKWAGLLCLRAAHVRMAPFVAVLWARSFAVQAMLEGGVPALPPPRLMSPPTAPLAPPLPVRVDESMLDVRGVLQVYFQWGGRLVLVPLSNACFC